MNKYIKKSLIVSMGALLSTAAFADDTYSYTVDSDNLLSVEVGDVTYEYQFSASPIKLNNGQTVALASGYNSSYENYIFQNVTGTSTTLADTALYVYSGYSISGAFIGNDSTANSSSSTNAGAIYVQTKVSTGIDGLFVGNSSIGSGGAITNEGAINSITGTFVNNSAINSNGGAISNVGGTITTISADFIGNSAGTNGGAIYNSGTISSLSGTFVNNIATEEGGAIFNTAKGNITIVATDSDTVFTGNTSASGAYAITNNGTLAFSASDGYSIILNDGINYNSSTATPTISISGAGTTVFNNEVSGQAITVNSGATLELGSYGTYSADLTSSTLTVNGTLALVVSDNDSTISLGSTTISSDGEWILDLSNITGDFVFNIDIDTTESSLDFSGLNIILGDDLVAIATYIGYDEGELVTYYSAVSESNSDYSVEYSLSVNSSGYTLTGTAFTAAVPEPSTYAMIFGVVALGFAAYRRRK